MRALVIDDAKAMRLILRDILTREGFHVVEASNGVEGLAQLEQCQFDLVLVDSYMPLMDGIDVIRKLRADESRNNVRVIMVTSEDESARVSAALAAGADAHLAKPFTAAMVRKKLELVGTTPSRL